MTARYITAISVLVLATVAAGVAPHRTTAQRRAPIAIRIDCYSTPEVVRITNRRNGPVFIATIGSLYRPRDQEPYAVNRRLDAGAVAVFRFGVAGSVSGGNNIFQNDVPGRDEGVIVATSAGTFLYRCSGRLTLPNTGAGP